MARTVVLVFYNVLVNMQQLPLGVKDGRGKGFKFTQC